MSATPLPFGPAGNGQDGSADDGLERLRLAVEEYRFQAEFNWKRTQYLLAFNVAVAALGVALTPRAGGAAIPIFALGLVAAVLTVLVTRTQHEYYRAARDRMRRIEKEVEARQDWRIDTTASLGARKRRVSVTQLIYLLLVAIALADVVSIVVILAA